MEAFDQDLGPNGALEYGLVDGDGMPATEVLAIDQLSGNLIVREPLTGRGRSKFKAVTHSQGATHWPG